jgi:enoyl-CoA hydratase
MPTVTFEKVRSHVCVMRLNRPERLNAMSVELCLELKDILQEVGHDNDCRIVILTGAGRAFCSGLDLKDHSAIPTSTA